MRVWVVQDGDECFDGEVMQVCSSYYKATCRAFEYDNFDKDIPDKDFNRLFKNACDRYAQGKWDKCKIVERELDGREVFPDSLSDCLHQLKTVYNIEDMKNLCKLIDSLADLVAYGV